MKKYVDYLQLFSVLFVTVMFIGLVVSNSYAVQKKYRIDVPQDGEDYPEPEPTPEFDWIIFN